MLFSKDSWTYTTLLLVCAILGFNLAIPLVLKQDDIVIADDTGYKTPGTVVDDSSIGSVGWQNVDNAKVDDGNYANVWGPPSGTDYSHYLKCTNFGFAIPSDATIDGIQVKINHKASASVKDYVVKLVKSGSVVGDNKASATSWSSSEEWFTYGGSTDLWGTTWTPSDINNANFGMVLSVELGTFSNAYVDVVTIMVYYSTGGTTKTWQNISYWSFNFGNTTNYQNTSYWSFNFGNTTNYQNTSYWSFNFGNTTSWVDDVFTWSFGFSNTTSYQNVSYWSFQFSNTTSWNNDLFNWVFSFSNTTNYQNISYWSFNFSNSSNWNNVSYWNFNFSNSSSTGWLYVFSWTFQFSNTTNYQNISYWSFNFGNTTNYQNTSYWSFNFSNSSLAGWVEQFNWQFSFSNTSNWNNISYWNFGFSNSSNVTIWNNISYWNFSFSNTSNLPYVVLLSPSNNSIEIPLQPILAFQIYSNNSNMNISIYLNTTLIYQDMNLSNQTISQVYYSATRRSTWYIWSVFIEDSVGNRTYIYRFRSIGDIMIEAGAWFEIYFMLVVIGFMFIIANWKRDMVLYMFVAILSLSTGIYFIGFVPSTTYLMDFTGIIFVLFAIYNSFLALGYSLSKLGSRKK